MADDDKTTPPSGQPKPGGSGGGTGPGRAGGAAKKAGGQPQKAGGAAKKAGGQPQKAAGTAKKSGGQPQKAGGAAKKAGGKATGPGGRPTSRSSARAQAAMARNAPPPKRTGMTFAVWGVVALVLVVVIVLVAVKATSGPSTTTTAAVSTPPTGPLPATIAKQVTSIPASVFNEVGISGNIIDKPTIIHGQPPLTYTDTNGQTKPGVFFLGAEFCPYCAAERWAMTAAMSRFGTFTGLQATTSNCTDTDPCTQTLSFVSAKLTSPYLVFHTVEQYSNQKNASTGEYEPLQTLGGADLALVNKYETSTYIQGGETDSFPFMDFGNKALQDGPSYDPSVLAGQSRAEIAANLTNTSKPATQDIIATANFLTAATCLADGDQPASVCTSKGVTEAATAMGSST